MELDFFMIRLVGREGKLRLCKEMSSKQNGRTAEGKLLYPCYYLSFEEKIGTYIHAPFIISIPQDRVRGAVAFGAENGSRKKKADKCPPLGYERSLQTNHFANTILFTAKIFPAWSR